MKKLFIVLLLLVFPVFGAVTTSTLTMVTLNEVYYISTEMGVGLQAQHISLYIDHTMGDEDAVLVTLAWMPDATWASAEPYIISERVLWWGAIPLVFEIWGSYNEFFRIRVPEGVSRLYVNIEYDGGTVAGWGTFKIDAKRERF